MSLSSVSMPRTTTSQEGISTDPRWRVKLFLRLTSSVFALISLSLFAAAIPLWNSHFSEPIFDLPGDWTDGMPIAGLAFAVLYNIIFSTLLLRRKHRPNNPNPAPPPHPVIPLILDFLVWGQLFPSILFAGFGGLFSEWRQAIRTSDGRVVCDDLNSFARQCSPLVYYVGGMELAGVVFACLVLILHVTLFIMASQDLHKWRMRRRRGRSGGGEEEVEMIHDAHHQRQHVGRRSADDTEAGLDKETEALVTVIERPT